MVTVTQYTIKKVFDENTKTERECSLKSIPISMVFNHLKAGICYRSIRASVSFMQRWLHSASAVVVMNFF